MRRCFCLVIKYGLVFLFFCHRFYHNSFSLWHITMIEKFRYDSKIYVVKFHSSYDLIYSETFKNENRHCIQEFQNSLSIFFIKRNPLIGFDILISLNACNGSINDGLSFITSFFSYAIIFFFLISFIVQCCDD